MLSAPPPPFSRTLVAACGGCEEPVVEEGLGGGPAAAPPVALFRRFPAGALTVFDVGTTQGEGALLRLQKYESRRFRSDDRSMNSKKWLSIFSTEAGDAALTVGTIFLHGNTEI